MNPFLEEDLIRCYKREDKEDSHICPICLDNDEFTYKSWVKLRCHHCFHRHCIKIWMEKKTTCPVCVQPIFDKTAEEMKEFIINIQREEQEDERERRERIIREYERGKEREKHERCTKLLKISFVSSAIGLFLSSTVAFLYADAGRR